MQQEAQQQDTLSWPSFLMNVSRCPYSAIWGLEPIMSSCPYRDVGAGVLGVPPGFRGDLACPASVRNSSQP